MTPEERERRRQEFRQTALENFPLKLIETTGERALTTWQKLKSAGQGSPVVLGGDDNMHPFDNILLPFGPNGPNFIPPPSVDEILRRAADVAFPRDLARRKAADTEASLRRLPADVAAAIAASRKDPPIGDWPGSPNSSMELSVARDLLTGEPLPKVYVGLAPTDDWTTIPAYLRWGGWNDCPAAEYHVAALRTWRDRYGAELVGMSSDTINLRVATTPETREEALALTRDQYIYCNDIIDQGVGTSSALAADLMANDWWYFWWD